MHEQERRKTNHGSPRVQMSFEVWKVRRNGSVLNNPLGKRYHPQKRRWQVGRLVGACTVKVKRVLGGVVSGVLVACSVETRGCAWFVLALMVEPRERDLVASDRLYVYSNTERRVLY